MKRTTIFIDEGLERELQTLARRTGRPMASVVREAVEEYVVARRRDPAGRLGFIAVGRSGHADTAERHEALLFDNALAAATGESPAIRKRPRRAVSDARRRQPRR